MTDRTFASWLRDAMAAKKLDQETPQLPLDELKKRLAERGVDPDAHIRAALARLEVSPDYKSIPREDNTSTEANAGGQRPVRVISAAGRNAEIIVLPFALSRGSNRREFRRSSRSDLPGATMPERRRLGPFFKIADRKRLSLSTGSSVTGTDVWTDRVPIEGVVPDNGKWTKGYIKLKAVLEDGRDTDPKIKITLGVDLASGFSSNGTASASLEIALMDASGRTVWEGSLKPDCLVATIRVSGGCTLSDLENWGCEYGFV